MQILYRNIDLFCELFFFVEFSWKELYNKTLSTGIIKD